MSSLDRIKSKVLDIASTSIVDSLFGKTGSSSSGLLSELGSAAVKYAGFADGGFTGHGGRNEPAGIVHRGEYVFDASATRRIGIGALEAMRGGLPGYASGGLVGGYGARPAMPVMPANGNGGAPVVNVINNGEPMQARVEQRQDGSMDVILDKIEGRTASRISSRRSPINGALAAATSLRG